MKLSSISTKKRIALIACVLIPILFIVIVIIPNHRTIELPKSILQLRLTEEIRGKQAQEIVNEMHKNLVTPDKNIIGTYFSIDGNAKLYVSLYDSRTIAQEQFDKMINLNRTGGGTFTHFDEIQVQMDKVYTCFVLGQSHFFFLHENYIYWWAVDSQIAQASIRELIGIVKSSKQK